MGCDNERLITKKTLWEQIAEALREDIIRGKITQEERIVEEELAARFHVSRGPVREALRHIEEEGLVQYESHKGCRVRTITYEEMQEKYLVRSTLEILAVRIIASNLPKEYEEEMEDCLKKMEKAAKKKDLYQIISLDEEFHSCIVRAARCDTLYKVWATLSEVNTQAYYTMNVEAEVPFDYIRRNHEIILKGLKERTVEEASKLIEEHYMIVPEVLHERQSERSDKGDS